MGTEKKNYNWRLTVQCQHWKVGELRDKDNSAVYLGVVKKKVLYMKVNEYISEYHWG